MSGTRAPALRRAGLRERKKLATRQAIADVAGRLFSQRGYDDVTVAEIAEAANVATKTVFNYFPTKESIFFDEDVIMEEAMIRAVRDRAPGESIYDGIRRLMTRDIGPPGGDSLPGDADRAAAIAEHARVFTQAPALQAYAVNMFTRHEETLARLIADDLATATTDMIPRVVAAALLAPVRSAFLASRQWVHHGVPLREAAQCQHRDIARAYDLLRASLADYGRRPTPPAPDPPPPATASAPAAPGT